MKGWLLDTNVVSEIARRNGDPKVLAWVATQEEATLYISVLTIGEYEKGIHNLPADSPARARFQASLAALEARFAERILLVDAAIARRWGRISGACLLHNRMSLPVIDTLLAATAVERDLCLVTRNLKDVKSSGAILFNPWTDNAPSLPPLPCPEP